MHNLTRGFVLFAGPRVPALENTEDILTRFPVGRYSVPPLDSPRTGVIRRQRQQNLVRAVSGISCINPIAPLGDSASA